MDQDPAVIRRQIEETRAALTEKLGQLEARLRGTANEVTQTVQTVRRTLSLDHQLQRHPWLMLGGCILAGFGLSQRLKPRSMPAAPADGAAAAASRDGLPGRFQEEIEMVKSMVIGVAMGYLRDTAKQALPQLAPQIQEVLDSATVKLGGKPIAGPLLNPAPHPAEKRDVEN